MMNMSPAQKVNKSRFIWPITEKWEDSTKARVKEHKSNFHKMVNKKVAGLKAKLKVTKTEINNSLWMQSRSDKVFFTCPFSNQTHISAKWAKKGSVWETNYLLSSFPSKYWAYCNECICLTGKIIYIDIIVQRIVLYIDGMKKCMTHDITIWQCNF